MAWESYATKRPAVLVVDDDDLLRMVLVNLLEDDDLEVFEAADAEEALSVLRNRSNIRVVITDIQMPGPMDGLALARQIRKNYPPVGLIVSSGGILPTPQDLPESALFFPKPINTHLISAHVSAMVA